MEFKMEAIKWLKLNWIQEKLEELFHKLYGLTLVQYFEINTVIYNKLQEEEKDKKEIISGLRILKTGKLISTDGATEERSEKGIEQKAM